MDETCSFPSRTSIHFLQESVRFHFHDLGRQCIFLQVSWKVLKEKNLEEKVLEEIVRTCKILQEMCES